MTKVMKGKAKTCFHEGTLGLVLDPRQKYTNIFAMVRAVGVNTIVEKFLPNKRRQKVSPFDVHGNMLPWNSRNITSRKEIQEVLAS